MSEKLEKRFERLSLSCLLCSNIWRGCYGCTAKNFIMCPTGCRLEDKERVIFVRNVALFKATISEYDRINHRIRRGEADEKELEQIAVLLDMQDKKCHDMLDCKRGVEEKIYRKIFREPYKVLVREMLC